MARPGATCVQYASVVINIAPYHEELLKLAVQVWARE